MSHIHADVIGRRSTTDYIDDLSGDYVMYTVRPGDNLWDIAKKFSGVSVAACIH